ncbi:MAG: hypothetical protein IPP98_14260 [Gemmatimonadetes bacterium]|nr:hypothetical protein [Gemmatimonadota bacterium]
MRLPIVMLVALSTAPTLAAQSPRDTVTATLVGPRETAEIVIDYVAKVPRHTMPWSPNDVPINPGLGEPIYLRTTLPLRFDGTEIPAGRYRLMTVRGGMGPTLVIQAVREDSAVGYTAARVPMEVTELDHSNGALAVQVRTTRLREDVVQVVDRSTPTMTRISKEITPGTARTLVLQVGKYLMRVPIAAR